MGKMMSYAETQQLARDLVEDKINDVFIDLQDKLNITSGDISPEDAFALDDLEDDIADHIVSVVMHSQYSSVEDVDYMIETLSEYAGLDRDFLENLPLDDLESLYVKYDSASDAEFRDFLGRLGYL